MGHSRLTTARVAAVACLLGSIGLLASCSRPELVLSSAQELKQDRRIDDLFRARSQEGAPVNYAIAPGDTLQVRVQQMEELSGELRVSEQGTIVLPLLGAVPVVGLTEHQTAEKLRAALADFVKDPQVSVAVAEIHGSQVSVMGAVGHPGVYPLRGLNRTIADLITQAGGMTKEAGTAIYFSPTTGSDEIEARRKAAASLQLDSKTPGLFARSDAAVTIELTPLYQGRKVPELALPVRPGDMIVVSATGEVFVEGWVNHPGAFRLTRGMTVTQAISGAGGLHFGGATGKVNLSRKSPTGENKTYAVDFVSISSGSVPDVYLENGDRIAVGANPAKAGPWGVFSFLKTIFSFGISGNTPTVGAK